MGEPGSGSGSMGAPNRRVRSWVSPARTRCFRLRCVCRAPRALTRHVPLWWMISQAVYPEPQYVLADETHPVRPLSAYGLSKYVGEK